jgi:hypothetical protein
MKMDEVEKIKLIGDIVALLKPQAKTAKSAKTKADTNSDGNTEADNAQSEQTTLGDSQDDISA